MKLIKSILLITVATVSFNQNVFAMQEPSAPYMDDQEESKANRMDMRAPRLPAIADRSSNICARCFCNIVDYLSVGQSTEARLCHSLKLLAKNGCCSKAAKGCCCHCFGCLFGVGCCAGSLLGMFGAIVGCGMSKDNMSDSQRIFCNGTGFATCALCAVGSGVYTAYQYCWLYCLTRRLQKKETAQEALILAEHVETIIQERKRLEPGEQLIHED